MNLKQETRVDTKRDLELVEAHRTDLDSDNDEDEDLEIIQISRACLQNIENGDSTAQKCVLQNLYAIFSQNPSKALKYLDNYPLLPYLETKFFLDQDSMNYSYYICYYYTNVVDDIDTESLAHLIPVIINSLQLDQWNKFTAEIQKIIISICINLTCLDINVVMTIGQVDIIQMILQITNSTSVESIVLAKILIFFTNLFNVENFEPADSVTILSIFHQNLYTNDIEILYNSLKGIRNLINYHYHVFKSIFKDDISQYNIFNNIINSNNENKIIKLCLDIVNSIINEEEEEKFRHNWISEGLGTTLDNVLVTHELEFLEQVTDIVANIIDIPEDEDDDLINNYEITQDLIQLIGKIIGLISDELDFKVKSSIANLFMIVATKSTSDIKQSLLQLSDTLEGLVDFYRLDPEIAQNLMSGFISLMKEESQTYNSCSIAEMLLNSIDIDQITESDPDDYDYQMVLNEFQVLLGI